MTLDELENNLNTLPDRILSDAAHIVAETAVESFKENVRTKAYDGAPWKAAAKIKRTGSLLVQSGALVNSIRPYYVGTDKVIITAGGDKVTYAKVHNEGFTGPVAVAAHRRKTKKSGSVEIRAHTKNAAIPKRQFMGKSREALDKITERIKGYLSSKKYI
ncbi:MAG: phage virion morphogenesis protein [Tannerellaceae bacterium]|jgi:phage gpG-like protein|nr:phage virion morphogenesis protein [Tannerellaceae bacterium]